MDTNYDPIAYTMSHGFAAVETSKVRVTLKQKELQRVREIQVLGFL